MSKTLIVLMAALASSSALAQESRTVSGQASYRERMALPDNAELAVTVTGFQGIELGGVSEPTGGRQVPLAFELAVPAGVKGALTAAIMIDGTIAFVGDPVEIAAGADDVDIGTVWLSGFTPSGFQTTWACGDDRFRIGFREETAVIETDAMIYELPQAISADGARFASEDGENEFWSKGDRASLTLSGETFPECVALDDENDRWTAQGNEPGWRAVINGGRFLLDLNYGDDRLDLRLPEAEISEGAYRYAFNAFGLSFAVSDRLCRDDMSGRLFPQTAELTTATGVLKGCGGDTMTLLAGPEWTVFEIGAQSVGDRGEVTISVGDDGRISGSAGCNRYMGLVKLGGEGGLEIGPLAATNMACDEPLMALERDFFQAIDSVDGFDIADNGDLVLTAEGETVIQASR
ncbi:META domain-containing protein [Martelella lutilitoris]|uniref:META domain-containing protein n=1 Tax=Martelella lutilitoris TaxID=2583532 RepID=A0A5C4JVX9_9HYPH|nr:META domain-containing protein [Martelella lutilitoris]TNB49628.1 META domain-containing protein [Martelella lutilitoris]